MENHDTQTPSPLNDLTLLKEWAVAYFNGIPEEYMLPSDRRLCRQVNIVKGELMSREL